MLSCIVDGKVLDWNFKKHSTTTLFFIGDILVGQLFKNSAPNSWTALAAHPTNDMALVDGFRTRTDACDFLLKYGGYDTSRNSRWNKNALSEQQLREKHPALQEAWERYRVMRNLYTKHEING